MMQLAANLPYVNASPLFKRHADGMVRALVLAASVIKGIVCGYEALSAFGGLMLRFLIFKRQPVL